MDKIDNLLVVHPVSKVNNNLKREPSHERNGKNIIIKYCDDIYYRDILLEKLAEEIMRFEVYKAKLVELEKKLEKIEKSKIVVAPLKPDIILTDVKKVNVNELNKKSTISKAIQAYNNTLEQSVLKKEKNSALVPKEEKISVWQKIKKAVKSLFSDEVENQKNDTKLNNYENNFKYNQFRQSIPKATIQIKNKTNDKEKKQETNHILDRYA